MAQTSWGISGRIAQFFQSAHITPLLALLALLLGLFAVGVTPREEEPQINVTMANVLIPFPGASAKEVADKVAAPAEQVLAQIANVEHVMSVSQPGMAVITVQFEVGIPRTEALVRLYDTVHSHSDWLPSGLGVLPPLIKPKGIDDVPIVALTLYTKQPNTSSVDLAQVAHSIESDLKRVKGTREVTTLGSPSRAIMVTLDPARLATAGLTVADLRAALQGANSSLPIGDSLMQNHAISLQAGDFLHDARAVEDLVVGVHQRTPILLKEVATVQDAALSPSRYVWHGTTGTAAAEYPAVTLAITKKPGQNAVDLARGVIERVEQLKNTVIPPEVEVLVSRNYGETANDKAMKLIQKLTFATASVVALVFFALGRREAVIVGTAVVLTLMATLFASWAWGFTLNRVSLFALIFSIGILVDDAIVVVENIHRHQALYPDQPLVAVIPGAVNEVGGPTILATLTVIAALLPMAFVTGLMGPYMSPIPINASMGMLISLVIAFVVTPWLARLWLKESDASTAHAHTETRFSRVAQWAFTPFLHPEHGARQRKKLGLLVSVLIIGSLSLPAFKLVVLKMLPFDNKSEFQVVLDMPADTPLEETAATLHEMGAYLATVPDVLHYQAYAGTAAPINFNGLVRQYAFRSSREKGDIQVNLKDKHQRSDKSHAIAMQLRPALQKIAAAHGGRVKVVEVPPGPPVLSPIVAEVYGPDSAGRIQLARAIRQVFERGPAIVDVDDSTVTAAAKTTFIIDRKKAALLGISQQQIVATLQTGMAGETVSYLHEDGNKYPIPTHLQLPIAAQGQPDTLLALAVRSNTGQRVPLRELVTEQTGLIDQPIYHKDLLPVVFVVGDMAGQLDSPLYGLFAMRDAILAIQPPGGGQLSDYFIHPPTDPYRGYAIKWDGEWQITYETFRDMGTAYAVGLVLIYLLVVAHFGSYLIPLIIMAPIPLTLIGVMPGHALLGAPFTATSMIGMIALAGIIVRNSILLVDFIQQQVREGMSLPDAVVASVAARAQPIILTGLAAMMGAFFILDDPIFNGLAISLIFGILVSTVLTLLVIPLLYFATQRHRHPA